MPSRPVALKAVYNYRLTDIDEYKAEVERRRQIGLTIDPATAETTFWWADLRRSLRYPRPEASLGRCRPGALCSKSRRGLG